MRFCGPNLTSDRHSNRINNNISEIYLLRKSDVHIKNANSLSASKRHFKVGELEVSPVMAVNKAALSLQNQALHVRLIKKITLNIFKRQSFLQK